MKKIIITGAHGFIGSSLTNFFLQKGYLVVGIDPSSDVCHRIIKTKNYIHLKEIDESNSIFFDADILYHLGWELSTYKNGEGIHGCLSELDNIKLSCLVANFAIKIGTKKFIFVGSNYQEMYYFRNEEIVSPKALCNIYGIAKRTAADLCRKIVMDAGIEYNNILLANTFGIGDFSQKAVNFFIKNLILNKPLELISGESITDWVYIDDTVFGLYNVGRFGKNLEEYYIGHNDSKTFKELICLLKYSLDSSSYLQFGKYAEKEIIDYSKIDCFKLYKDTPFILTDSLENQFRKTAIWVKENLMEDK